MVFTDAPYDISSEMIKAIVLILDSFTNKNIFIMLIDSACVELIRNCKWHLRSMHFCKISFALPAGEYFYRRHIPILHFSKGKIDFINTHEGLSSVYDLNKYRGTSEEAQYNKHAKPVDLPERFIKSFKCSKVLDLFGGYGSTLIASEKQGKDCFIVEILPRNCDMIIQRYENFTGEQAELLAAPEVEHA